MSYSLFCIVISQIMFMIINIMFYSFAPIVGSTLFQNPIYANLPIAVSMLTMVSVSIPFGLWSEKQGRKPVFTLGCIITIVAGLFFYLGLQNNNAYIFTLGAICLGIGSSTMSFYRFAAMEIVEKHKQSFAISAIMLAGVLSAFLAPNIAIATRSLLTVHFSASFLLIIPLAFIALLFISQVKWKVPLITNDKNSNNIQWAYLKKPMLIGAISYFVMMLLMTATPLHMHNHNHPFTDTAFVIQWHMIGMFAPSLITGYIIKRTGLLWLSYIGVFLLITSVILNLLFNSVTLMAIALFFLGMGWNFSFISSSQMLIKASSGQTSIKIQGINDFIVFGFAAIAGICSSLFLITFGWQNLNLISLTSLLLLTTMMLKIKN